MLNNKTAKDTGSFDRILSFSPKDIDAVFFERNKNILQQEKGNGYWLWKPYFIQRVLGNLKEGDLLFYCDSGSVFLKNIDPLFDLCSFANQDVIPFESDHIQKQYTKRDAFILMGCDSPEYTDSLERLGGFSVWRKSEQSMFIVSEWLRYAQDERILTDLDNQCGVQNYPGFVAHRHDQSILALLTKKHKLIAFRDPSQYGDAVMEHYPASTYDRLILLTRQQHHSIFTRVKRRVKKHIGKH